MWVLATTFWIVGLTADIVPSTTEEERKIILAQRKAIASLADPTVTLHAHENVFGVGTGPNRPIVLEGYHEGQYRPASQSEVGYKINVNFTDGSIPRSAVIREVRSDGNVNPDAISMANLQRALRDTVSNYYLRHTLSLAFDSDFETIFHWDMKERAKLLQAESTEKRDYLIPAEYRGDPSKRLRVLSGTKIFFDTARSELSVFTVNGSPLRVFTVYVSGGGPQKTRTLYLGETVVLRYVDGLPQVLEIIDQSDDTVFSYISAETAVAQEPLMYQTQITDGSDATYIFSSSEEKMAMSLTSVAIEGRVNVERVLPAALYVKANTTFRFLVTFMKRDYDHGSADKIVSLFKWMLMQDSVLAERLCAKLRETMELQSWTDVAMSDADAECAAMFHAHDLLDQALDQAELEESTTRIPQSVQRFLESSTVSSDLILFYLFGILELLAKERALTTVESVVQQAALQYKRGEVGAGAVTLETAMVPQESAGQQKSLEQMKEEFAAAFSKRSQSSKKNKIKEFAEAFQRLRRSESKSQ